MKQILGDECELQHVLDVIKEQWSCNPAEVSHVPTADYLAGLIRRELIECGGVEEDQIVDTSSIANWFLVYESAPGSWQHVFADCLLCIMLYFREPIGEQAAAVDKLYALNIWQDFERRLTAVLTADFGRIEAQRRRAAEHSLEYLAPAAKTGKKIRAGGDKGRQSGAKRSDPERDAAIFQAVEDARAKNPKALVKVIFPDVGKKFGGIGYEAVKAALRRHKKPMAE